MKGIDEGRKPHRAGGDVESTDRVETLLDAHVEAVGRFRKESLGAVRSVSKLIVETYRHGGRVLVCGNGGSAADSQHFVAELVGRFAYDRAPLEAHALTTNTSIVTAVSNDYGYEDVFARQVDAMGKPGDVLVGISTSGRSGNVTKALRLGRKLGMKTVSLVGDDANDMGDHSDYIIRAPGRVTARIQELHILAIHMICDLVERALFTPPEGAAS